MSGEKRRFSGKIFKRGNYLMTERNAAKEVTDMKKTHYVRRVKGPKYKTGGGHWYHIYYRKK